MKRGGVPTIDSEAPRFKCRQFPKVEVSRICKNQRYVVIHMSMSLLQAASKFAIATDGLGACAAQKNAFESHEISPVHIELMALCSHG